MATTRKRRYEDTLPKDDILPAPFSHEDRAVEARAAIDYSKQITLEEAKAGKAPRRVRIYADGIYDMFHSGHARQLMQAKMALPNSYLIVGVCNDSLTRERKGKTVMNEVERYEAIRHCRYVDEVLTGAPWTLDEEFLNKYKIDFVAHDDAPYSASGSEDIYQFIKDRGMFLATQRTEGISTTDVIARIIRDYDNYVRRNLARGYTRRELNVGYMKEKQLLLTEQIDKSVDRGKAMVSRGRALIDRWEDKSKEFVDQFIGMFKRDGRLNTWLTEKVQRALSPTPDEKNGEDTPHSPTDPLGRSTASSPGFEDEEVSEEEM